MKSTADEFWVAITRRADDRGRIGVELVRAAQPESRETFTAQVVKVSKPIVFLQHVKSEARHCIDFQGAHISIAGFEIVEPFGMVRVFDARWESSDLLSCKLMDPRETAIGT